jgi:spore coat protein U-like protein
MKTLKLAALTLLVCTCVNTHAAPTSCSASAVGVAFGSYNPLANVNSDSTGSVSVTCTGSATVSYSIAASAGSGTFVTRQQLSGTNTVNYNIYIDNARTMVWGDGTAGTNQIAGSMTATTSGTTQTSAVYGRIFSGQQAARVGSYSDTLTLTVTY